MMLETALALRDRTDPGARIAVIWAGILPYFSERTPIDLLGKSDREVARGPDNPLEPPPLPFFRSSPIPYCWPGHSKRNYLHSIRDEHADLVQPWFGMTDPEIRAYLSQEFVAAKVGPAQLYVNRTSPTARLNTAP